MTHLAWPLAWGFLSGLVFFLSLAFSLHRALASAAARGWLGLSLLLRAAPALLAFYASASRGWAAVLACLAGFLLAQAASVLLPLGQGSRKRGGGP